MINNDPKLPAPDFSKMSQYDRRRYFSAAKTEITMPDRAPRIPKNPRSRRHSVRHRAIR